MTKMGFVKINGVAVTAFVLSIVVGALLSRTIHHPAPIIVGALLGLYLLYAIKVVRAMGEGGAPAPWPLRRSSRAGNISHHSCRGYSQPFCGPTRSRGQRDG